MSFSRVNPGRYAAALACIAVEEGAHLEDVLAEHAPYDGPDRGLAWFLAYGVQRCRGRVDAALRPHLRQPLEGLEAPVRAALRLGSFELQFARTGRHAAVHQSVELIKALRLARASGLVNAVLRRVDPDAHDVSGPDALDAPPWMHARWTSRYGVEAAEAWLRDATEPPPLFLAARGEVSELADALSREGIAHEPTATEGLLRVDADGSRIEDLPGFDDGLFWVQDLASVRVADLVRAKPGQRVLDACAAPGGKSFRLATQGAKVYAADRSRKRLAQLRASAQRLGLDIRLKTHDWSEGPAPGAPTFDAVLVDAPCTAVGTLRRHPELKWRRQLMDVLSMAPTQQRILRNAATHTAPGGTLVYAVCSPEPEEGQQVVDAFLREHSDFRLDASFTTAPPEQGEDAFFGARMIRA